MGWFERIALKPVYYHQWNWWPVRVQYMKQGTQSQCSRTTQRDGRWRAVGGGLKMGGIHVHPWLIHVTLSLAWSTRDMVLSKLHFSPVIYLWLFYFPPWDFFFGRGTRLIGQVLPKSLCKEIYVDMHSSLGREASNSNFSYRNSR